MPHSYSDNAVMTKVRALYGKRLSEQDYDRLVQMKSVSDVAAYLKNETYYADSLAETREDLIHRGQLETLVRRRTLDTYIRLLKYSYDDTLFMYMYMTRSEINQLLLAIRLLNAGEINRYIISLPAYLTKYMSFDLFALARVHSFDELLDAVAHSEYYAIIKAFRPMTSDISIDITACEAALLTFFYKNLCDMVEKRYSGNTRADLLDLLYFQIDFHNISAIYRLGHYFHYPPDKIRPLLLPLKSGLSRRVYEEMLEAGGADELLSMLGRLPSLRRFPVNADGDNSHIIAQTIRMKWSHSQKRFRFSTRPVVAVISYMTLLDIEIDNITNIIEGIRYKVPADEIYSLLAI